MYGVWSLGLGTLDARAMLSLNPNTNTAVMAILANIQQTFLAGIYLIYNPLVALMFSANWWASVSSSPCKLVVSSPTAQQTGPPLLGMPLSWGVAILLLQSLLHWLFSQSLLLVHAQVFDYVRNIEGTPTLAEIWAGCGYSLVGAVLAISGAYHPRQQMLQLPAYLPSPAESQRRITSLETQYLYSPQSHRSEDFITMADGLDWMEISTSYSNTNEDCLFRLQGTTDYKKFREIIMGVLLLVVNYQLDEMGAEGLLSLHPGVWANEGRELQEILKVSKDAALV
ncbi:hypothetical protein S40288_09013 [Stachybotrys chartarum IBT 40288]|nr:hypothetical protein S40288_09013 [Stachybotrys chartarum IBT 40288]